MNRLSSYIFFLLITGVIVFTACKKDHSATPTVYMPNALGVVKVTFEMADTPYIVPVSAVITGSEYATVVNAVAGNDIVVHFKAAPAKVDFFNEQNGTDYRVLPEGSYEMPAVATITKGASITAATGLKIYAKGKIDPFQDYMIPVSIENIEGASASAYQQTTYYVVNATADLNSMVPYDQAKWTIAGFSTEEPAEGGGNGLAARAIDNDPSTFWNSKWSGGEPGPPHYFIVDMGEEKAVHGIGIMDRYFEGSWQTDGHGQPQDITVSVSADNAAWTDVAVLKDIPHDPGQPWYKYFVSTLKQARYVKFTVTKVYGTSSTNIAEVQVF
ncbi:BT_3987 domain-containing protein [Chitinophaga sp. ARDCPP14]|uniref:BT_3987 domain-containing protein n=1 Tax=Chitinophaga sp. ARDCPP14 TaxID=3391139 RepID=UPI003F527CE0